MRRNATVHENVNLQSISESSESDTICKRRLNSLVCVVSICIFPALQDHGLLQHGSTFNCVVAHEVHFSRLVLPETRFYIFAFTFGKFFMFGHEWVDEIHIFINLLPHAHMCAYTHTHTHTIIRYCWPLALWITISYISNTTLIRSFKSYMCFSTHFLKL